MTTRRPIHLIRPDRVRHIGKGGFAFIPNRFLHEGFFESLTQHERSLYFFLVLAADRRGVSYYAYDRICSGLRSSLDDYILARNSLIDMDLVAFDGTAFQVLALPASPVSRRRPPLRSSGDLERHDPATIRQQILDALGEP
jgi:hypothetical protein